MTLIVSLVAISGIVLVNSRYHGAFLIGLLIIVVPVLVLSFGLPHLLPVRCTQCGGKTRFRFGEASERGSQIYSYVCERCAHRHDWEGSSSGATLDG